MEEIIKKAQNGDKEALNKVIEEIESPLYKIAILRLKNEEDANDVVQNTMLLIYKNLKKLKEPKYFKTWTIRILINECNKYYKTESKEKGQSANNLNMLNYENEIIEITQQIDTIKLLEKFGTKDKNIMILHINGYKNSEIAEVMKMKENTVKTRIRRCKEKIKQNYEYDKKEQNIRPKNKALRTVISIILVLLLTTGFVYGTIVIVKTIQEEHLKQPQAIKCERLNVEINADNTTIMEYMKRYDNNAYYITIQDVQTLEEMQKKLDITFEEKIRKETFNEWDVILIAFLNEEALGIRSISTYQDKLTITFEPTFTGNKNKAFCLVVHRPGYKENIEIIYEGKIAAIEPPEGAVHFRYSSFYIENIEKFEELDLKYDREQDIYYTELLNQNSYNKIKEELGIITTNKANVDLTSKEIALVFKKTNYKLVFDRFNVREEMPHIRIRKTEEQYGFGITGVLVGIDEGRFDEYIVELRN